MRVLFVIFVCICFFSNCKNKNVYEKEIAVIDSTKIVLQVKLNELKRAEQNIESVNYAKFETYAAFLKSNIKDTINKVDATAIQTFLKAGSIIQQFNTGKSELIHQTELSVSQLQKLASDVKENVIQPNGIQAFYTSEKSHAEELIAAIEQNIKALNLSITNYRNSIIRTEEYIKQINNGSLPTVVADSTLE